MTSTHPPLDYTHLDNLSADARNALQTLLTDETPEWHIYYDVEVLWLLVTIVGERPACMFDTLHIPAEVGGDFTCPYNTIIDDLDIPSGTQTSHDVAEDRLHFEPEDYPEMAGNTVISNFFAVSHDAEFAEWFDEQTGHVIPDGEDEYVGRALGFPEDAITAFLSDDWDGTNGQKDVIKCGLDDCPNPRYIEFAPYVAAPTEEGVRQAIRTGKHYDAVARQIARDRPEYAAITDLLDRAFPTDESWNHYLGER